MFIWPVGPLHLHGRMRMSHNEVSEIKKIVTRIKIDIQITFSGDKSPIITYCAGRVQMTYEPIQYVHLNPFPVE